MQLAPFYHHRRHLHRCKLASENSGQRPMLNDSPTAAAAALFLFCPRAQLGQRFPAACFFFPPTLSIINLPSSLGAPVNVGWLWSGARLMLLASARWAEPYFISISALVQPVYLYARDSITWARYRVCVFFLFLFSFTHWRCSSSWFFEYTYNATFFQPILLKSRGWFTAIITNCKYLAGLS